MSQNLYVIIGLCVFFLLLGTRIRKWLGGKKEKESSKPINKNQRGKIKKQEYPTGRYRNRERVKRIFTIIVVVVLILLMFFMIPTLTSRVYKISDMGVDENFFLQLLIFILAAITIISGLIKLRKKDNKKK